MSGLGPLIRVLIPLTPFLVAGTVVTMAEPALIAVGLGIGVLGVFGAYTGSISGQRWCVGPLEWDSLA